MKKLAFNLPQPVKNADNIICERALLISKFLDRLNAERVGTKFKPLTARAVAIKVGHLPTEDLYGFYKQCKQHPPARSFGWVFFGALKPRK